MLPAAPSCCNYQNDCALTRLSVAFSAPSMSQILRIRASILLVALAHPSLAPAPTIYLFLTCASYLIYDILLSKTLDQSVK